jgi:hypothetical protein
MESEITKIIHDKKSDLSPLSIKTYANSINKVLELIKSKSLNDLFLKHKEVVDILSSHYDKPNTRKTKLASVTVFLRCILNEKNKKAIDTALAHYGKEIEGLTGDVKNGLVDGEKSDKQKTNWITKEETSTVEQHLKDAVPEDVRTPKDLMHFRNYVLFSLYQDIPTRNEMADTKIIFKPTKKAEASLSDEYNYIILDRKTKLATYILNTYKTSKVYGKKTITLAGSLYPLLLQYKSAVDKFNGDTQFAFLNNSADAKLTRNRLGVIYSGLGSVVGKKLGTSLNRHIAISDLVPLDKMKALADKMGNSVGEQVGVYAKV